MSTFDSERLYKDLESAVEEITRLVKPYTKHGGLGLAVFAGSEYISKPRAVSFFLKVDDVEVRGIHLGQMAEELVKRLQFRQGQETLRLGAPTIEPGEGHEQ